MSEGKEQSLGDRQPGFDAGFAWCGYSQLTALSPYFLLCKTFVFVSIISLPLGVTVAVALRISRVHTCLGASALAGPSAQNTHPGSSYDPPSHFSQVPAQRRSRQVSLWENHSGPARALTVLTPASPPALGMAGPLLHVSLVVVCPTPNGSSMRTQALLHSLLGPQSLAMARVHARLSVRMAQ